MNVFIKLAVVIILVFNLSCSNNESAQSETSKAVSNNSQIEEESPSISFSKSAEETAKN